ncbi:trypsin-like peptidase domain-containing protein [Streptomyces sp. Q6]|uniref:Trypsin-like peptidase domain-containing protein n=1 Tax=Streptomyces citrinus TaxID=3118173 RepID=A0ACD5AA81_9ACTN
MSDAQWVARVECAGRIVGSGFLVAGRTVLTCAHVVAGGADVTVSFPHRPADAPVAARVLVGGGWRGDATTHGDLAVLELAREVDLAPARLAHEATAYGGQNGPAPTLLAYGFPKKYDEGTIAEYRTKGSIRVLDEWVELVALDSHGQPLDHGFSGAALAVAGTNRVVGMVTSATGGADVLTGRMMPLSVMARYWPDLALYLPGAARLTALVERVRRLGLDCNPERLYRYAAGAFDPPVPPHGLNSLEAAAMYALDAPDAEVAERLADRLTELVTAAPERPRPARRTTAWSPVLFTVEHTGAGEDEVRVEVSAYHEGHRHLVEEPRTVPVAEVGGYVASVIDAAMDHLPDETDELVAFQLPRRHLNWPVAHWPASADNSTPMGCAYPVVVTATARRGGGSRRRLVRRWQESGDRPTAGVHRVGCSGGTPSQWDLARADVVGFAAPPAGEGGPHDAALAKPVPALLWPRAGCDGGHRPDETCPGAAFLDAVGPYVSQVSLAELPRHIMELRERASGRAEHWAGDVQLLWDAPHCFPAPPRTHAHCPVA